ncbi:MAG: hypothetical protein IT179_20290 [Acidobacteria bacterium]|nr:hypothetical protein [Acidobacteriota bacterium]
MNDTPPAVDARVRTLLAARSGSDRVRMACEMFTMARALMVADIRRRDPAISDAELRVRVFERLYGDDLDEGTRARIVANLRGDRAVRD